MKDDTTTLTQLGKNVTEYWYKEPVPEMLEVFKNKFPNRAYSIELIFPEFTSLCPKTGQPDFAVIEITYCPKDLCLESKSIKMYLFAFRSAGAFMETITNQILEDCVKQCSPRWMKVLGKFNARGGLTINVTAEYCEK